MMTVVPSPTPTATSSTKATSPVTVTLNYSPIEHNFVLTVKGATEVSYLLKYFAKSENISTEQAITHGGSADPAKLFTATHLAGTESGGTKVFHQVTSGGLELLARLPNKSETRVYKTFTINDKGVIKVTDVTAETLAGMVQGASTESAELATPAAQIRASSLPMPVRTSVPATTEDTSYFEATPASTMPSMAKMWPFLAFVGGVLLLVLVGIMLRQRFARPRPIPPTPVPPPITPTPEPPIGV